MHFKIQILSKTSFLKPEISIFDILGSDSAWLLILIYLLDTKNY